METFLRDFPSLLQTIKRYKLQHLHTLTTYIYTYNIQTVETIFHFRLAKYFERADIAV